VKRIGNVGGGGPGARPLKPERTATSGTKVKRTLVPRKRDVINVYRPYRALHLQVKR